MNKLFLELVNMSLTAGWLIIAVAMARHMLKKAPKNVYYVLWAMVAVRLVCPFSIESSLSLIPNQTDLVSTRQVQNSFLGENGITTEHFTVVWLAGALIFLGYSGICYIRLYSKMCTAIRLRDDIWQSEFVLSPFVVGIVNPKIYVPYDISDEELQMVVAHERAHLKQRDHIIKLFAYVILAIYWFNPLVWVAYILLCRDIEIACDERVVKDMSLQQRKMYSEALLSLSVSNYSIAACPIFFGEVGVKMRIKRILGYRKSSLGVRVQAVAACILLGVCFLSNPEKASGEPKKGADLAKKELTKGTNSSQESNVSDDVTTLELADKEDNKSEKTVKTSNDLAKPKKEKDNKASKTEAALGTLQGGTTEQKREDVTEMEEVTQESTDELNQVARPEDTKEEKPENVEGTEDVENEDDVGESDSEESDDAQDNDESISEEVDEAEDSSGETDDSQSESDISESDQDGIPEENNMM